MPGCVPSCKLRKDMRLALCLALATALVAATAHADDGIKGLRVVVPDARGKSSYGTQQLSRSLRRTLAEAIGPLISSRDLESAQKKLKQKPKEQWEPAN